MRDSNIDKKCAEYGFRVCDYPKEIYDILNSELKKLKDSPADLVDAASKVYKNVMKSLSEDVKSFEEYVKLNELENLVKYAENLQNSNISDKEKIDQFTKERKFSNFATECENSIRKVLGILSVDGVFASVIWIESKEDEKSYRAIKYQISKFLHEIFKSDGRFSGDPSKLREEILKVCDDIHQMFFIKQILEQMLTYALYRARSLR